MIELTIGELARRCFVNIQTIRYYERIGLVPEPGRTAGGHRRYSELHLRRVEFIRRGRELGFPLPDIEQLLRLAGRREGSCAAASQLAAVQLRKVRGRIEELRRLEEQLAHGLGRCRPEEDPTDCPVIDLLATGAKDAPTCVSA